ncbi:hypothetical protein [Marinospirillum sp.]|uniref:helix-turn-helix domain-containing protein n=1 Tax=Marinospirillum sp. TaxID=2183934 RepID=UPI002870892F|nr:hypothetical protein [Marinospirillum sp.]MDR9467516.1 hypothetical protein [Marinospirillum sp.]
MCAHLELESEFGDRLRQAIGQRSILSFAKECGISDSLIRKYLAGSVPGLAKAVIMARVSKVSLEWLATGKGHPQAGVDYPDIPALKPVREEQELLETVAKALFEELQRRNLYLEPAGKARLVRVVYRHFAHRNEQPSRDILSDFIDLAAYQQQL